VGKTQKVLEDHIEDATTKAFKPGDAGYTAIIGTRHGQGPARILRDYENELGRKEIASFEVEKKGSVYNMLITLQDV
jgi:hypothetical protein